MPPEETQQQQHKDNILRINLNTVITTVFGVAIMGLCSGIFTELKKQHDFVLTTTTQLPLMQQQITDNANELRLKVGRAELDSRLNQENETIKTIILYKKP